MADILLFLAYSACSLSTEIILFGIIFEYYAIIFNSFYISIYNLEISGNPKIESAKNNEINQGVRKFERFSNKFIEQVFRE